MNKKYVFAALAASVFVLNSAYAIPSANRGNQGNDGELLQDLKNLTQKCVVRPVTVSAAGATVLLPLKSTCQELILVGKMKAAITLENQNFYAEVVESQDSDGGDLDHLVIRNTHGRTIAIRRNVLAFDDVLIALAGGEDEFPQVRQ